MIDLEIKDETRRELNKYFDSFKPFPKVLELQVEQLKEVCRKHEVTPEKLYKFIAGYCENNDLRLIEEGKQ